MIGRGQMFFNRFLSDVQLTGNFSVRSAGRGELCYLALAGRESGVRFNHFGCIVNRKRACQTSNVVRSAALTK